MKKSPFYYIFLAVLIVLICFGVYATIRSMIEIKNTDIPFWAKWYMLTR